MILEIAGVRLHNPLNNRKHWRTVARRGKTEKAIATGILHAYRPPSLPVSVTLTRVAPRAFDSDNLAAACKHVRDAVAAWLGVDDADPRVAWSYAQAKAPARTYGVRIELTPHPQHQHPTPTPNETP